MKSWIVYCILFTLGIGSVFPTIWGTFVFDDGEAILKNNDVTCEESAHSLVDIFKHDFWGVNITHQHSHKSFRPFTTLTFRWDHTLWGKNPLPFHLINTFVHGLNCVLVYLFLLKCKFRSKSARSFDLPTFWAAIIFSVHPTHVEPNGTLVGRADLFSSFIFLCGFIFTSNESKLSSYICITIAAIIGSLFKENAIVVALYYIALNIMNKKSYPLNKLDIRNYVLSLATIGIFVSFRIWLQDGPPTFQQFDNPPMFAPTYFSQISSVLYVWMLNLYILVCPIWLCYDWSMGCISLITSPFDIRFGLLLICIIVGIRFLFVSFKSRNLMTALLIFITTFLPSSNIIFTVGFVLAERNLYLPSIGYSFILSHVFLKKKRRSWMIFIVTMFFLRSVQRSCQWTNQNLLFISGLSVCPNNAKIHYNLGTMYGESGNLELAITSYKTALDLKPDYYQAMNNLGNILRSSGDLHEAEHWLRSALKIKEDFAAAWMNLGIVLSKKNSTEALYCYKMALRFRNPYPDCLYNLGNLYLDMGEKDLALKTWMRTISLKPSHSQAWTNVLISLEQGGKLKDAKEWAIQASKILTQDDTLQFLMGNILGKLGEYEEAKRHFQNSINMCVRMGRPVPSKYWSNLGVLYHRWGKKTEAVQCYEEALKLDPNLTSARDNIKLLQK